MIFIRLRVRRLQTLSYTKQVRSCSCLVLALGIPTISPQKTPLLPRLPILPLPFLLLLFFSFPLATIFPLKPSGDFLRGVWHIRQGNILRPTHQDNLRIVSPHTPRFLEILRSRALRQGRRRPFGGYALEKSFVFLGEDGDGGFIGVVDVVFGFVVVEVFHHLRQAISRVLAAIAVFVHSVCDMNGGG